MQIRVNRNIDNYKPDVFHGLDFSQTMHALGTVIAGASAFLFANFYLHLPQTHSILSLYPLIAHYLFKAHLIVYLG